MRIIRDVQPDELYNLGAQSFVQSSWQQPILTANVTAVAVTNVLEALRALKPDTRLVVIGDFATISVRCTILSSNDDYSGATMGNATVPAIYRGAVDAPVRVHPHAMIGVGSILLPGITVGESACVGAASLVKADVAPFDVVAGVPARVIGRRRTEHRALAEQLLREEAQA